MKETLEELCPYADVCDVEYGDDYICKTDYAECGFYRWFLTVRNGNEEKLFLSKNEKTKM